MIDDLELMNEESTIDNRQTAPAAPAEHARLPIDVQQFFVHQFQITGHRYAGIWIKN